MVVQKLYARINNPWRGLNSGWAVSDPTLGDLFNAYGPTTEAPNDTYWFKFAIDFESSQSSAPFAEGDVIQISCYEPLEVLVNEFIFTKP